MSFKIKFALLCVLNVGIITYFSLIGNIRIGSTVELNKERKTPKAAGSQNYTETMRLRVTQYQHRCKQLKQDQSQIKLQKSQFIVNNIHQLLYCMIPKVACTNLRRVFLILTLKLKQTDPLELTHDDVDRYEGFLNRLHTYPKQGIRYKLRHYRKVIFVREPFQRILSAYRDKFLPADQNFIKSKYGSEIIRKVRPNASMESLDFGNDISFSEFVQYLIYLHKNNEPFNQHWATYSDLCSPCKVQYDFIGRFETLDDDVDFLLESIGVGDTLRFPRRNETYNKTTKTNDVLYEFYRDIEPSHIEKLREIYANDFKLFDYALPEGIMKVLRENGSAT